MDFDIRIQVTGKTGLDQHDLAYHIKELIAEMTGGSVWIYPRESKISREIILEVQHTERKIQIIPSLTPEQYAILKRMIKEQEGD